MHDSEVVFKNYPLTSRFLGPRFSEISELYFKNFPDEQGGFYLPTLLRSLHKELDIPTPIFEIADFESSVKNLSEISIDVERVLAELELGEIRLNPALAIHRFQHDILTFSQSHLDFKDELPVDIKPNITFIAKDLKNNHLYFLKGTPELACVVDYLAEGKINLRLLSAQLQRNFSTFFPSNDAVLESVEKLIKKYIVLQK